MYKRGETSFDAMTDLAKSFRATLAETAEVRLPAHRQAAGCRRRHHQVMLEADNLQGFEMVYIPDGDRATLCISSQVGCAMDCSFCATAQQGFNRNLTAAEIVGQVFLRRRNWDSRPATTASSAMWC